MAVAGLLPFLDNRKVTKAHAFTSLPVRFVSLRIVRKIDKPAQEYFAVRKVSGLERRLVVESLRNLLNKCLSELTTKASICQVGDMVTAFPNGCHRKQKIVTVLNSATECVQNFFPRLIEPGHIQNVQVNRRIQQNDVTHCWPPIALPPANPVHAVCGLPLLDDV